MSVNQDEAISSLIRITARGFYGSPSILVLEALLWHKVLSDDDLRALLNIQPKELRVICSKLVEDRLVTEFKQREPIPNRDSDREREKEREKEAPDGEDKDKFAFQRHITRIYYYIHHSLAIDAVKWKVDNIVRSIDSELSKINEKGFICPTCKKKFSELDIQSLFNDDFTEAYCNICNTPVIEDDFSEKLKVKHERSIKLKGQLDPILQWLKKIDEIPLLEDNNIESCFLARVPASDGSLALYTKINKSETMFDNNSYNSMQNKAKVESTTIRVNIAGDNEDEARKQEESMKQKVAKAEQNALPSWYQESTVGKSSLGKLEDEKSSDDNDEDAKMKTSSEGSAINTQTNESANITTTNNKTTKEEDELAAYYEKLKEAQAEGNDDEDEVVDIDDEDFDDFEDV